MILIVLVTPLSCDNNYRVRSMEQQKSPNANISLPSALIAEDGWVCAGERRLREAQEAAVASLPRSQLAGQRIRELRRGVTLGGLSIKELIEDGRE